MLREIHMTFTTFYVRNNLFFCTIGRRGNILQHIAFPIWVQVFSGKKWKNMDFPGNSMCKKSSRYSQVVPGVLATLLQHHYHITSKVEKHNIPPSLILNSDQSPSKYVQVGQFTMASKGAKKVGVAGSADKGKTNQSLPKDGCSEGFSLSVNIKHHSNTEEVLKHIEDIVIPYMNTL